MSVHSLSYEIQISLISSSYLLYFFPTLFSKLRKLSDFTITLLHFLLIFTDGVPYKSDRPEYYPCLSATPDKALSICQLKFHHLLEMENKLAEDWRIKTKLKGQLPMHQYIERIKLVLISIYSSSFFVLQWKQMSMYCHFKLHALLTSCLCSTFQNSYFCRRIMSYRLYKFIIRFPGTLVSWFLALIC